MKPRFNIGVALIVVVVVFYRKFDDVMRWVIHIGTVSEELDLTLWSTEGPSALLKLHCFQRHRTRL